MEIFVQTKNAGRKGRPLERHPYTVPDAVKTLRELITAIVRSEVERYNRRETDPAFYHVFTRQELEDQAETGRVSFGRRCSGQQANADAAVAVAIQGFEDGLLRVVIGQTGIETLDAPLQLRAGDTATFIRLTFLAGAFW